MSRKRRHGSNGGKVSRKRRHGRNGGKVVKETRGTPERLLSTNLASKLLVAIVSVGDVWLEHERFATPPPPLALDGGHTEEPEAA